MKRYSAAALAVAAAVALSACSSGAPAPEDDEEVVLTFANWEWLEPGRGEQLWNAMQEYKKVAPHVTLEKLESPRSGYEQLIQTQIGAGAGPDLLVIPTGLLPELASARLLVPLTDEVSSEGDVNLERESPEGERVVYTWEVSSYGFFWNKEILEQADVTPPHDMESLLAAAIAIKEKTGKPGFAVRSSLSEEAPWWEDFQSWIYGFGGSWVDGDQLRIDHPANVEAVAALKRLYDSGAMPIGDDASTFRSRFANGEIGMMFDNAAVLFTILAGDLDSDDVGVSTLPFPTDNSSQNRNYIGVNKNSAHIDAAMDFIAWLSTADGQKATAAGVFPTLSATTAAPPQAVLDEYPWIDSYREQAKTAKGGSLIPGFELETPQIRTIVLTAIERVLAEDADPASALAAAQKEASAQFG